MKIANFISAALNALHNLFQTASWGVTFYLLILYI